MIKSITNFLIIFLIFQQLKSQLSQIDQNGFNPFCDEILERSKWQKMEESDPWHALPKSLFLCDYWTKLDNGYVHMRTKHIPKEVSERDSKRDWDHDLNYVRSHALQTPSQSRSGSVHYEVIFCSYCAIRADWPMHGFSMASVCNSKLHMHESRSERALRSHVLESGFLRGSRSKAHFFFAFQNTFQKPDLKRLCIHKG